MRSLNKYGDFIVEKIILEQLLLESNVIYSAKFKRALSKLPDNEIAQKLLEIENKDLEVVSNFFDVKIDNDNILTFTPDRVAQEILGDTREFVKYVGRRGGWLTNNVRTNGAIFARLGFTPATEEVFHPNNNDAGEVISRVTSEKTNKTWCYVKFPTGEGVYNIEKLRPVVEDKQKIVFTRSRQEIRTGRAVRVLLQAYNYPVTDAKIETFVNEFRAVLSIMNDVFSRFEIVEGDELGFWYNRRNYEFPHQGTLGGSCQAVGNLRWLQIYIDNPQTVKLLMLRSENYDDKIIGRALLWTLDDGRQVMDTIYTSKDSDRNVFIEYGNSKGYIQMTYGQTFTAHINPGTFEQYPSVDNMNNWNPETGQISNRSFPGSRGIIWSENDGDEEWEDDDAWRDDD
jgi:hypothetical protein